MAAKGIDVPHLHCANHTAPRRRVIQNLLASFLDGRSPHTLTAYGRDLDDFARFLTGSRQAALGRFFVQPAPAANADVLRYRHELVARHLAPATINRRLVAIRSLTKLARLLGIVPWAIEVQDVPQETLRDTQGPGVETVAEMLRLAGAPRDSYSARNVAMLPVMFDLALRVSEVRQLDVADLELDRRALLWVSGKDRAEKELLSLPETTLGAITAWLRVRWDFGHGTDSCQISATVPETVPAAHKLQRPDSPFLSWKARQLLRAPPRTAFPSSTASAIIRAVARTSDAVVWVPHWQRGRTNPTLCEPAGETTS